MSLHGDIGKGISLLIILHGWLPLGCSVNQGLVNSSSRVASIISYASLQQDPNYLYRILTIVIRPIRSQDLDSTTNLSHRTVLVQVVVVMLTAALSLSIQTVNLRRGKAPFESNSNRGSVVCHRRDLQITVTRTSRVSYRLSPLGGTIEVSIAKSLVTGSSGLTASLLSVCYVLGKQDMKICDAG